MTNGNSDWGDLLSSPPAVAGFGVVFLVAVVVLTTTRMLQKTRVKSRPHVKEKDESSTTQQEDSSKEQASVGMEATQDNDDDHDVWAERRRRGIVPHSLHHRSTVAKEEKPFGSSYYYAHNSNSKTGGYRDGLRMEDFTMNQPRLLSRSSNGNEQQATAPSSVSTTAPPDTVAKDPPSAVDDCQNDTKKSLKRRRMEVTRYLWDDPGESTGIGTIRIDQLPSPVSSTQLLAWKDASIQSVTATVISAEQQQQPTEGLVVDIQSDVVDYRLHIPKLYGAVDRVETVQKQKRLLVKLYKKTTFLDRSNRKAWPHPQQKKAS